MIQGVASRRSAARSLVALALAIAAGACSASDATAPVRRFPPVARPLKNVEDAYASAATPALPSPSPLATKGLKNVFKLSPDVYSGSEPDGDEGLAELAALGVKTVVSVDGKMPNADGAAKLGLRYVHIPIEYKGLSDLELVQLTKTFRELDGPFYVHCFHGKHRGPAAAAVARLAIDGAPREQVLAEMRQWCGTAAEYPGLFRDIASKPLPSVKETQESTFQFPARRQLVGFRMVMIDVPRRHDALQSLLAFDWAGDPAHPDLDAGNEAKKLAEDFAGAQGLAEVKARPADFQRWLTAAVDESTKLAELIPRSRGGDATALADSRKAFADLTRSCVDCHAIYRNQ